jgi:hypothetical protein
VEADFIDERVWALWGLAVGWGVGGHSLIKAEERGRPGTHIKGGQTKIVHRLAFSVMSTETTWRNQSCEALLLSKEYIQKSIPKIMVLLIHDVNIVKIHTHDVPTW